MHESALNSGQQKLYPFCQWAHKTAHVNDTCLSKAIAYLEDYMI